MSIIMKKTTGRKRREKLVSDTIIFVDDKTGQLYKEIYVPFFYEYKNNQNMYWRFYYDVKGRRDYLK